MGTDTLMFNERRKQRKMEHMYVLSPWAMVTQGPLVPRTTHTLTLRDSFCT